MHHTYLGTARDLCGSGTFPFASFFFGLFPPKVILKLFILFFWEKKTTLNILICFHVGIKQVAPPNLYFGLNFVHNIKQNNS